jgi:hypothetical protein
LTLSFWINCNKAGTYCVCFNNNAAGTPDRAFVAEYTISAADVSTGWVKKTIAVPASPSAGTWNYTNSNGCRIDFSFANAIGGTYQGSANGQWNTVTNYVLGTSSSTNFLDSTSNTAHITGIQLEVGNAASELEWRPFGQELDLCQRYYEKNFNLTTAPADALSNTGATYYIPCTCYQANEIVTPVVFKVRKRSASYAVATYSYSGGSTAGRFALVVAGSTANFTTWNGITVTSENHMYGSQSYTGATAGFAYLFLGGWTVDNEI